MTKARIKRPSYKHMDIYIQTRTQGGGKGGNTPPWGSQGGVLPPPELQPQMETAHFPRH